MLETNADFTDDDSLQGLDKEDALVAFEDHIRELERVKCPLDPNGFFGILI
jgi:exonuclease VII small subunit